MRLHMWLCWKTWQQNTMNKTKPFCKRANSLCWMDNRKKKEQNEMVKRKAKLEIRLILFGGYKTQTRLDFFRLDLKMIIFNRIFSGHLQFFVINAQT